MLRLLPVNDFATRKKLLVLQSDIHRHTFLLQFATIQASVEKIKHHFTILGVASAAAGVGASLVRSFFSRHEGSHKRGLVSKVLSGFSYFGQLKSLFHRFTSPPEHKE